MTRYCDIVMKGGITSGVVYPLAAVELAKSHRFRNIGGTSAGAIAAAATAAAEYRRRKPGGDEGGYERIAGLPTELGKELTSLFQPTPPMQPLFKTLLSSFGGGPLKKLLAPLSAFPAPAIAGALPGAGLIVAAWLLNGATALRILATVAGVLLVVPMIALFVGLSAALRLRRLPGGYYGICLGNDRDRDAATPPLTRWLAELIDEVAGKEAGPLTFGDLWALEEPDGERGVNLQMITTCLSQGRPYSLPFEAGEEFWFDPEEFLDLFPEQIVSHMLSHSPPPEREVGGAHLRLLPPAEQMPVLVAARLSLSFPLLIAAVPLYALNDPPLGEPTEPQRCWFSDGGIASNFPIHFFDAPIPRWPTFGIDLMPLAPGSQPSGDPCENVWMPETNEEGIAESWIGWEGDSGFGQLGAFAISIFRTAQNWIDNRQMRGAGFRDRIAHVRLAKEEGGMNLTMSATQIESLAQRGACAAKRLSERFEPKPPLGTALTWDNQRWIRYRTYMERLERQGAQARRGFEYPAPLPFENLIAVPPSYPWVAPAQREFATGATAELLNMLEGWEASEESFAPRTPPPPAEPWSIPRI